MINGKESAAKEKLEIVIGAMVKIAQTIFEMVIT
jgi:hypothetical protein